MSKTDTTLNSFLNQVITQMPEDWLNLTTHRLDIYDESNAKTSFLSELEMLFNDGELDSKSLASLPTAYDYIRLGHPLSSLLEWSIGQKYNIPSKQIIAFDSRAMPLLSILRENKILKKATRIIVDGEWPEFLDQGILHSVYGYDFETVSINDTKELTPFEGTQIKFQERNTIIDFEFDDNVDIHINHHQKLGSILLIQSASHANYVSAIQHSRRRESIAMTPHNSLKVLQSFLGQELVNSSALELENNKSLVHQTIQEITKTNSTPLIASSGLSMQYAIVMGLIDDAKERYPGRPIKIVVPPNCYGGTNDQARRVAASVEDVDIMDLPVDGGNDMVESIRWVLKKLAQEDAVPLIIAEIPTNPRVEIPNLKELMTALTQKRLNLQGKEAIEPIFILDQTFCPNTHFLGKEDSLNEVNAISYVSGSKFPSGGKCTAGYCVANEKTSYLLSKIESHHKITDNEATPFQYKILAQQMPSMLSRIERAYRNTREYVNYIQKELPEAKINFVSSELANLGFTPSVFSLDLPSKGRTGEEKELFKRTLNLELINRMIRAIPDESKYCVSYGQLKGSYWTIPATSTQGTTKEGDKDYIVRVSISPDLDLEKHKAVFSNFVEYLKKALNKV